MLLLTISGERKDMESSLRRAIIVAIILLFLPVVSSGQTQEQFDSVTGKAPTEEKFNNDAGTSTGGIPTEEKFNNDAGTSTGGIPSEKNSQDATRSLKRNESITPEEFCSDHFGKKTKEYKRCVQQAGGAIGRK